MGKRFCVLRLPSGRELTFSYGRLKLLLGGGVMALAVTAGLAGYLYWQLEDYRREAAEFAEYKEHKAEQRESLQQLLQDNEIMLRNLEEIAGLEKKLRRALMQEGGSGRLSLEAASEESGGERYTGLGCGGGLDRKTAMGILQVQNDNLRRRLGTIKSSVKELLGKMEGRSGTLAFFPDRWPTAGGVVSSSYGGRYGPVGGDYEWHTGLDIAVAFGTPVYAAAAGTVEEAGWNGGYGRYIRLEHHNGYKTAYGHMSWLAVSAGQQVAKGELIGLVGSSGYSTGPHLHYELLADGRQIDPFYILKQKK